MGFSLAVSVRSPRLKHEMHAFLSQVYKPWSEILDDEDELDNFEGPYIDDDLDTPGKCCIGFDYHQPVAGAEREYHFALIRWIAIRIGKRRSKFRGESLELAAPVPYVLFDGVEASPVLLKTEWPHVSTDLRPYVCDTFGIRTDDSVAMELAWYCLPEDVFDRVSATHYGRSSDIVCKTLIQEGLPGANRILQEIRAQIAQLDLLWEERLMKISPRRLL